MTTCTKPCLKKVSTQDHFGSYAGVQVNLYRYTCTKIDRSRESIRQQASSIKGWLATKLRLLYCRALPSPRCVYFKLTSSIPKSKVKHTATDTSIMWHVPSATSDACAKLLFNLLGLLFSFIITYQIRRSILLHSEQTHPCILGYSMP